METYLKKETPRFLSLLLPLVACLTLVGQAAPVRAEESATASSLVATVAQTAPLSDETAEATDASYASAIVETAEPTASQTEESASNQPPVSTEAPSLSAESEAAPVADGPASTATPALGTTADAGSGSTTAPESVDTALETASEVASTPAVSADTVTIVHTNDIHGRLEEGSGVIGVAKAATIIEEIRQAGGKVLVVDAGDAFQGLPISNNSEGAAMAKVLNMIGYDAMAVGNHEFDFGYDQAMNYKSLLNFPILSSNVYKNGQRSYDAYTIVEKDGEKFAIIGVTTPETATKTHPNNIKDVVFTEPIDEVKSVIDELLTSHQDIKNYIVLAHLGIDETTKTEWRGDTLAKTLASYQALKNKQVTVIDGHSHSVFNQLFDNVQYAQTGTALANIGKVLYNLGQNNYKAELIPAADTSEVAGDAAVAQVVADAKAVFEEKISEVLVENNPVLLSGVRDNVRVRETNLGNLVADALYNYTQTGFAHAADLAVTNGGGLRASIEKDQPITIGDTIAVLPFGNIISQIQVTGQQILEMFKTSLSAPIQTDDQGQAILDENTGLPLLNASGGLLHSSGVKVYFDPRIDPETGERIFKIQILDKATQTYKDLVLDAVYHLATNDFIAAGGDAYTMLSGAREEGPSLDQVFAEFIRTADLTQYEVIAPNSRLIALDLTADNDQDGFDNATELAAGSDPLDAASIPQVESETEQPAQEEPVKEETAKVEEETTPAPTVEEETVEQTTVSTSEVTEKTSDTVKDIRAPKSAVTTGQAGATRQAAKSNVLPLSKKSTNSATTSVSSAKALPKTGQKDTAIYVASGAGLLCVGLVCLTKRNKKAA